MIDDNVMVVVVVVVVVAVLTLTRIIFPWEPNKA